MTWCWSQLHPGRDQHFFPRSWLQQLEESPKPCAQETGAAHHHYNDDYDVGDDDHFDIDEELGTWKKTSPTLVSFRLCWQLWFCAETDVWWNIKWNIDESCRVVQNDDDDTKWWWRYKIQNVNKHLQTLVTTLVLDGNLFRTLETGCIHNIKVSPSPSPVNISIGSTQIGPQKVDS